MQHVIGAGHLLAGVGGDRAARVDDDHAGAVPHARHHVVEEQVGLGLEGIGADQEDRVGERVVLVAVVQLADAHVAGRVHLGVVGRPVVNPAVLDLHRAEIELARAPGVLVAAGRAAVVEHRDVEIVLVVLVDVAGGDPGNQIERIVPRGRLPRAVTPDHRLREPLLLGAGDVRTPVLRHARAAHRAEARVDAAVDVRLDHQMHVLPVLLDDVVHGRRVPELGLLVLLLAEVDAELVRRGRALLVDRPRVRLVAAADDAVVAGDVMFPGVCGDDRQTVDLSLVCHLIALPQSTLERRP